MALLTGILLTKPCREVLFYHEVWLNQFSIRRGANIQIQKIVFNAGIRYESVPENDLIGGIMVSVERHLLHLSNQA